MRTFAVCLLAVGASCGGDDGHGATSLDDFSGELSTANCAKQFECCTGAEITAQYMGITYDGHAIETEAQCVEFTNAVFSSLAIAHYRTSIEQGRATYDGDAAGDCIGAIEEIACAQFTTGTIGTGTDCRPFLLPKVTDGGACTQDYECTSDNCEGATNPIDGPSTDGACAPMPGDGEPCDDNCATGLYCTSDLCAPTKADGQACNVRDECESGYCDTTARLCAAKPVTCDGT